MTQEIPNIVIGRLPIYLRELNRLAREENKATTSSHELGNRLGISSAQIRKDLSHFGEFGKQGTGYHIQHLIKQLRKILHLTQEWDVAVIGAGFLGHAIANYKGFSDRGFCIACIFDNDSNKIGKVVDGLTVQPDNELETTISEKNIKVAIIAVPAHVAQSITDRLINVGVTVVLSYAPIYLNIPEHVKISYIDPVVQLQQMAYYLE